MFNHHQNTKSNSNNLCFIWQSTIDHPRNNKKKRERKIKVLLNVNKTPTNSDILCFIAKY